MGRLAEAIGATAPVFVAVDQDETRRIEELRGQGWSVRAIAAEVGCSKSAVSRRVSSSVSHHRQGRQVSC